MGRRDSSDIEAIRAQAVISRTFALKNRGKRTADGFDLNATVADQVYGGVTTETPLAWWAVRGTTGQVLTWQGGLIDAFFSSTCGGRTAEGTEVYVGADRPYLRSIEDVDADGQAYCRISPRFRWREEWTGDSLRDILRRTLPVTTGVSSGEVNRVVDVRVTVADRLRPGGPSRDQPRQPGGIGGRAGHPAHPAPGARPGAAEQRLHPDRDPVGRPRSNAWWPTAGGPGTESDSASGERWGGPARARTTRPSCAPISPGRTFSGCTDAGRQHA